MQDQSKGQGNVSGGTQQEQAFLQGDGMEASADETAAYAGVSAAAAACHPQAQPKSKEQAQKQQQISL